MKYKCICTAHFLVPLCNVLIDDGEVSTHFAHGFQDCSAIGSVLGYKTIRPTQIQSVK